jgi:hypothetical protein
LFNKKLILRNWIRILKKKGCSLVEYDGVGCVSVLLPTHGVHGVRLVGQPRLQLGPGRVQPQVPGSIVRVRLHDHVLAALEGEKYE